MRNVSLLLLSAIFSGSGFSFAEQVPPSSTRVAVVHMQTAIKSVAEGKKAEDALKKEWDDKQKKLEAEGKKIQTAVEDLRKQAMVMDEKTRREKEESIQAQMMKLKQLEVQYSQDFQKKDLEVSEPIIKKIRSLVALVAKERGYSLVVDGNENSVIFVNDQDNITAEVIKRYDAKK